MFYELLRAQKPIIYFSIRVKRKTLENLFDVNCSYGKQNENFKFTDN